PQIRGQRGVEVGGELGEYGHKIAMCRESSKLLPARGKRRYAYAGGTDADPVGGALGEGVQLCLELGLGYCADHLIGDLALLHEQERRNRADPVSRREARVLVDVDLGERDLAAGRLREVLEDGRDGFTRTTPFSPEVHHHDSGFAADRRVEIIFGQ